jgi:hypothetical protein
MKYRKLRITFSAVCGVFCLLLLAFWVRSYVHSDTLSGPISDKRYLLIGSLAGAVQFRLDDRKWSDPSSFHWKLTTQSVADLNESLNDLHELDAKLGAAEQPPTRINMTMKFGWMHDTLFMPYWSLLLLTAALPVAVAIKRPYRWRFSLRTLLIATTVVAVGLGLIFAAAR